MSSMYRLVSVSVHVPKQVVDEIDELVRQGRFASRSDFIRIAIEFYLAFLKNQLTQLCSKA